MSIKILQTTFCPYIKGHFFITFFEFKKLMKYLQSHMKGEAVMLSAAGKVATLQQEPRKKDKLPETFLQQSVCVQWDQIAVV